MVFLGNSLRHEPNSMGLGGLQGWVKLEPKRVAQTSA